MTADCLFCKIAAGQVPSEIVYQDDHLVVFKDIRPVAPVHLLLIPRKHVPSVAELDQADAGMVSEMIFRAKALAEELKVAATGYRLVFNVRDHAGQMVDHLHLHLIGGQKLGHLG
ncbi:MAG: histidine triad nucleotide-binding protein [Candidatus Kerfeldbacteria bacterium]|nr:histidine triad nucleotide-binding protein [Candidatus Kerfeldbacteria bacterium]